MAMEQTSPESAGLTIDAHQPAHRRAAGRHPRLRRFAIDAALTAAFNVLIALIITYLTRLGSSFGVNLVFSMCIGMLAFALIDGGRLLLWGEDKPSWRMLPLVAAAIPLAYYGGHTLAVWLLDMPHHQQPCIRHALCGRRPGRHPAGLPVRHLVFLEPRQTAIPRSAIRAGKGARRRHRKAGAAGPAANAAGADRAAHAVQHAGQPAGPDRRRPAARAAHAGPADPVPARHAAGFAHRAHHACSRNSPCCKPTWS